MQKPLVHPRTSDYSGNTLQMFVYTSDKFNVSKWIHVSDRDRERKTNDNKNETKDRKNKRKKKEERGEKKYCSLQNRTRT